MLGIIPPTHAIPDAITISVIVLTWPYLTGRLDARSLCGMLACLQPEGAIIVDESLTSGGSYWDSSKVSNQSVHGLPWMQIARPECIYPHEHKACIIGRFIEAQYTCRDARGSHILRSRVVPSASAPPCLSGLPSHAPTG